MPNIFSSAMARSFGLLAAVLLNSAAYAQEGKPAWVHGSWVNMRATAGNQGAVVEHLVVNTEATMLSRQGEWCEIRLKERDLRGFVSCKLLGDKPLTRADVAGNGSQGNAARAFWLAPSAQRLMAAGDHFRNKLLSERQRASEEINFDGTQVYDANNPPKILRYPAPEFDAMKALLKAGIVAAPENRPAAAKWSAIAAQLPADNSNSYQYQNVYFYGTALTLARAIKPQPVAPSLFKRHTDLAARSVAAEQLSAQFGIVERMRVLGGPQWVFFRNENPNVAGYWDLGSYELSLDKPVVEYTIGRNGLASAKLWKAKTKNDIAAEPGCNEGMGFPERGTELLNGYPKVKDPLVWFYTAEPLPFKKVAIKRYAKRITNIPSGKPAWQEYPLELVVSHEIDINGDGIADLSVWEGMPTNATAGAGVVVRFVLANIAGEWFLIESDSYTECS